MKSLLGSQPEHQTARHGNPFGERRVAVETSEAAASTTAPNITRNDLDQGYSDGHAESRPKLPDREQAIAERRGQIPKLYRGLYDRAVGGRSRKAGIRAFCTECCGYQIKEVFRCTDLACPLYSYRPASRVSPVASQGLPNEPEARMSGQTVSGRVAAEREGKRCP